MPSDSALLVMSMSAAIVIARGSKIVSEHADEHLAESHGLSHRFETSFPLALDRLALGDVDDDPQHAPHRS